MEARRQADAGDLISYRDDLDAAHARSEALDREVVALEQRNRELVVAKRVGPNWGAITAPLIATAVFAGFTVASLALAWGVVWSVIGIVLAALAGLVLIGSGTEVSLPKGAVPVRFDLELESAEGDAIPVKVIAVVRVATSGAAATHADKLYGGRTTDDVAAAATALLESLVRAHLGGKPRAELEAATLLDRDTPPGWCADSFVRLALEVDSLWVGPA